MTFRSARGYTTIELMLVLVLTGLLTSFAIFRLGPSIEHAKVRSAANVVAADLQYAQSLAVRNRRPVAIVVQSSTHQYIIRDRADATQVFRRRSLGQDTDFDLDELVASPSSVELFPTGVARATTTFTVGLRGFRRQIRLTRAGQIRIVRSP